MVKILIPLILSGMLIGWTLRRTAMRARASAGAARAVATGLPVVLSAVIYLLLFFLGVSIGGDATLMARIPAFGLTALWLTLGAVAGCMAAAWALEHAGGGRDGEKAEAAAATSGGAALRDRPVAGSGNGGGPAGGGSSHKNGLDAPEPLWKRMRGSLIILCCFVAGLLLARFGWLPEGVRSRGDLIGRYILFVLIFLVGLQIGLTEGLFAQLKGQPKRYWFLPLCTVCGSLAGVAAVGFLLPGKPFAESLAVGSGFAYYSLSSILIGQTLGAGWATVALLANILREMTALLAAPLLSRISRLGLISVGGATSMDTTLPTITRFCGPAYAPLAAYHGFLVDLSVPFLVSFFCQFGAVGAG